MMGQGLTNQRFNTDDRVAIRIRIYVYIYIHLLKNVYIYIYIFWYINSYQYLHRSINGTMVDEDVGEPLCQELCFGCSFVRLSLDFCLHVFTSKRPRHWVPEGRSSKLASQSCLRQLLGRQTCGFFFPQASLFGVSEWIGVRGAVCPCSLSWHDELMLEFLFTSSLDSQ